MDGADPGRWSDVAENWTRLWGRVAEPTWEAIVAAVGGVAGLRVLDVGCGAGDLLVHVARLGASVAGVDPAEGMVAAARDRLPGADIRAGAADRLPWPAGAFDLVTSVNALHFADDTDAALAEAVRVLVPGGHVAVANWAEDRRNDLGTVEAALAGEEPGPDGDLRLPGGLESLLADAGLTVVAAGLAPAPWEAPDEDTLVRGILLGEDEATVADLAPSVLAAADPFRTPSGGYLLGNAFRWAVARAG